MRTIPLKRVASVNDDSLPENCDPDLEFRYVDISAVGDGRLVAEPETLKFSAAPSRARRLTRSGDTLVSTVRTYLRAVCPVDDALSDAVVSTGFAVVRAQNIDPSFLSWVLRSSMFVDEVVNRSTGVSYPAINPSDLISIRIPCPSVHGQRAIADFLDAETARIDELFELRERQKQLVSERLNGELADHLHTASGGQMMPLRHCSSGITVGVVIEPSSYFTQEGVPFIHGTDVREGWIDCSALKFLSEQSNRMLQKSTLRSGDVVAMRVGYPGRAAVVPEHLDGANCASILILRRPHLLTAEILVAYLNSSPGKQAVGMFVGGAAQGVLNVSDAARVSVPKIDRELQPALAARVQAMQANATALRSAFDRWALAIAERKQALITAAVTGQLDLARTIAEEAS